jgi:hypothetical protein
MNERKNREKEFSKSYEQTIARTEKLSEGGGALSIVESRKSDASFHL